MSPDSLRILVLGYIVSGPLGGLAWHHLQYVLGLARLGHDVLLPRGQRRLSRLATTRSGT